MTRRNCPVCGSPSGIARIFTEENIDKDRLNNLSFASRKSPEFMSHRLVHCPSCDLIYADDPPDQEALSRAYQTAAFDSTEEAEDAAETYAKAMRDFFQAMPRKSAALEIGAGTGAFLAKLLDNGFETVIGVEPSSASIACAKADRKLLIREGIFDPADFEPMSFDLICCFMTLEHVRDPLELLRGAYSLLRSDGSVVLVTHDHRAPLNRLLGRWSPIIDIEHMQLFSPSSLECALQISGYEGVTIHSICNRYSVNYWARLLPLPRAIKSPMMRFLRLVNLDQVKLSFNVGNVMVSATRPHAR